MEQHNVHRLNEQFTGLSDRFRSLWTFYQFLGGVFKHRGEGDVPYTYDFQALYRRLQEMAPRMGVENPSATQHEYDQIDRELTRIHGNLTSIESDFPPSLFRKFFDHLKRQDEKILFALSKFYLLSNDFTQDTLDKLDILLTRLAEAPFEGGRIISRDPSELRTSFERMAGFAGIAPIPPAEAGPLVEAVRDFRTELRVIEDFQALIDSKVYDRYRKLKQRLGKAFLHPPILAEIVVTNIEAKNQFRRLFQEEEARILEETNRVFEVERFLERSQKDSPELLTQLLDEYRESRLRFDTRRREDNIKREDIQALRQAMQSVLAGFEEVKQTTPQLRLATPPFEDTGESSEAPFQPTLAEESDPFPQVVQEPETPMDVRPEGASLTDLLPPDPLLNESLHKIMFAVEMVVWDRSPDRVITAPELHNLNLEPWEVASYRKLVQREVQEGTTKWDLQVFFLRSAALRVKMEEERREISRLDSMQSDERAFELLERSAQSLERGREIERRFQWFVDDTLYDGDTEQLEHLYRSRFRFLNAYSALWLEHQAHGGLTPL
jgi:hypothetical protein